MNEFIDLLLNKLVLFLDSRSIGIEDKMFLIFINDPFSEFSREDFRRSLQSNFFRKSIPKIYCSWDEGRHSDSRLVSILNGMETML